MTKATHKRKHFIWGSWFQRLHVHDHHDGEGTWQQAGKHDARAAVESLYPQAQGQEC